MGKKKRNVSDDDDWDDCPECGREVKTKNLDRHLSKMHSDMSKKNLNHKKKGHRAKTKQNGLSKAELRKEMERDRQRKNIVFAIAFIFIFIAIIGAGYYLGTAPAGDSENLNTTPQPVKKTPEPTEQNEVRIQTSEIDDGKAHYYSHTSDGVEIRYFVLKSSDGKFRAAFDACDTCYESKRGYRQEGDNMVCNNCGLKFASVKINEEKGGCNPAPLDRNIDGSELVIDVDDIEAGRWYFA